MGRGVGRRRGLLEPGAGRVTQTATGQDSLGVRMLPRPLALLARSWIS